jgi:hypothetical protein
VIKMAELNNQDQGGDAAETRDFGEVISTVEETTPEETQEKASAEQSTAAETETESSETEKSETEDKAELSEKGTKLDPNPLSRAHQELANEKRLRTQMEQVLASPKLLAQFMEEQYGIKAPVTTEPKGQDAPQTPDVKEFKAEDLESLDDVAVVLNTLQKGFAEKTQSYESEIKALKSQVEQLTQGGRDLQVANKLAEEVSGLKKEPELDSESPDFVEGLEQKIAEQYYKLDFDVNTGRFRGNYSLDEIARNFLEAVRMGKTKGSIKAQTVVKDKTSGKVVTSPKVDDTGGDEENLSAQASIAQGVSKLFRK